jgi:hypothetical protein
LVPHAAITRSRGEPATIAPLPASGSVTSIQAESDSGLQEQGYLQCQPGTTGRPTAAEERASPSQIVGLMTLRHPQGSRQVGIWVAGQEAVSCLVVYERVIGQPLDGTARGAGVAGSPTHWPTRPTTNTGG